MNFPDLDELTNIAGQCDLLEGNYYTFNQTTIPNPEFVPKQRNLFRFGQKHERILEIGFNAGHSASILLNSNPSLELWCLDIGIHSYIQPCFEYLRQKYGDRIHLIISDSRNLPHLTFTGLFDGIHIDGNHDHPYYILDTLHCLKLLTPIGEIILDDTDGQGIRQWADYLQQTCIFSISPDYEPTLFHRIFKVHRTGQEILILLTGNKIALLVDQDMVYCNRSRDRLGVCRFIKRDLLSEHVQTIPKTVYQKFLENGDLECLIQYFKID